MGERVSYQVPKDAAGKRLDHYLAGLVPSLSRSQLEALIEAGKVLVEGASAKKSRKLKGGEAIEVFLPDPPEETPRPQDLPLHFLYEDQDLVVLDKAPGVVVHPAAGVPDGTLVNALLFHVKDLGEGEEGALPGIVHRLDRDTSGCLVVAKHERALHALQASFQERLVEKRYLALCHGVPEKESFTLDTPYGRHPTVRTRYTTRRPTGKPRRAVSHVKVLERFSGAALVEVLLETGRTHQIRVHLSESGHPLLADREYGGTKREARLPADAPARRAAEAIGRQALHAQRLSFPHPSTGVTVTCESSLPEDFARALALLRGIPADR